MMREGITMPSDVISFNNCFLTGVFLLVFCSLFLYHPQKASCVENPYPVVEVHSGDRCVVSGLSLDHDDIVLLVKGRRVPMKKEALSIFLDSRDKYFSKFEPKGALFTEDITLSERLSMGWFVFGIYVLIGLVFGAITSHCAVEKGLKPIPWFFSGFFLNIFGYIVVAVKRSEAHGEIPRGLEKVPLTMEPNVCRSCGHQNHPSAKNCSGCSTVLSPCTTSEIERL